MPSIDSDVLISLSPSDTFGVLKMDEIKDLLKDPNGMMTYEYIVNNVETCADSLPILIDNLKRVDSTGQFLASSARFLSAVDKEFFSPFIPALIEGAIDKDRERKYIGSLLEAIWGPDYHDNAEALKTRDDCFRRVYKRIYPRGMFHSLIED